MNPSRLLQLVALLAALMMASAGARAGASWDPFIGRYEGEGIADIGGNLVKRDLGVTIARTKRGFSVAWDAVTRYEDGRVKRRQMAIDFEPTRRAGIFE